MEGAGGTQRNHATNKRGKMQKSEEVSKYTSEHQMEKRMTGIWWKDPHMYQRRTRANGEALPTC